MLRAFCRHSSCGIGSGNAGEQPSGWPSPAALQAFTRHASAPLRRVRDVDAPADGLRDSEGVQQARDSSLLSSTSGCFTRSESCNTANTLAADLGLPESSLLSVIAAGQAAANRARRCGGGQQGGRGAEDRDDRRGDRPGQCRGTHSCTGSRPHPGRSACDGVLRGLLAAGHRQPSRRKIGRGSGHLSGTIARLVARDGDNDYA